VCRLGLWRAGMPAMSGGQSCLHTAGRSTAPVGGSVPPWGGGGFGLLMLESENALVKSVLLLTIWNLPSPGPFSQVLLSAADCSSFWWECVDQAVGLKNPVSLIPAQLQFVVYHAIQGIVHFLCSLPLIFLITSQL